MVTQKTPDGKEALEITINTKSTRGKHYRIIEVGYVTPHGGLSRTLLPWLPGVRGRCQGIGLPRHAEMVPFVMLLMPHVKALPSWVVTLLVGVVVIIAIREEFIACEQKL